MPTLRCDGRTALCAFSCPSLSLSVTPSIDGYFRLAQCFGGWLVGREEGF